MYYLGRQNVQVFEPLQSHERVADISLLTILVAFVSFVVKTTCARCENYHLDAAPSLVYNLDRLDRRLI
jgi:hypothetical protein